MAVAIIALVMAIAVVVKNADIINKDALIIGMQRHGFVSCQCLDEEGTTWYSKQTGFSTDAIAEKSVEEILIDWGVMIDESV